MPSTIPKSKILSDSVFLRAVKHSYCPICLRSGKKKRRKGDKMLAHYKSKHPRERIPDEFYTGPRNMSGMPIPAYSGPYPPGTRVMLIGHKVPLTECPLCGKHRLDMHKHYDKKHNDKAYPDGPWFQFYRELESEIEEYYNGEPKWKATVWDVTPAGYGGPKMPATLHVRLDKPIDIHSSGRGKKVVYYSKASMSVFENEVRLVKKK